LGIFLHSFFTTEPDLWPIIIRWWSKQILQKVLCLLTAQVSGLSLSGGGVNRFCRKSSVWSQLKCIRDR